LLKNFREMLRTFPVFHANTLVAKISTWTMHDELRNQNETKRILIGVWNLRETNESMNVILTSVSILFIQKKICACGKPRF
jgi:hypothetical protein